MEREQPAKRARKRVKLECLLCGSQFDDDYRKKHEQKCHKGMRVQVKIAGAPSNPFEASMRRTKSQHTVNTETTNQKLPVYATAANMTDTVYSSVNATVPSTQNYFYDCNPLPSELQCVSPAVKVSSTPTIPTTAEEVEFRDVEAQETADNTEASTSNKMSDHVDEDQETENNTEAFTSNKMSERIDEAQETENNTEASTSNKMSEHIDDRSSTEYDHDFGEGIHISVLKCAGQLNHLVDCLNDCKPIIDKLTKSDELSALPFLMETIDIVARAKENCSSVLNICGKIVNEIEQKRRDVSITESGVDSIVEHDPGKRSKIQSDNQRHYLISLGPYQPKLGAYPINGSIPHDRQRRFNSAWYKEYPFLEYSTELNAAFCFVCCLFPEGPGREKTQNAWVESGVDKWHKMKSVGKEKDGKLAQHFSSNSHRIALSDYCQFMMTHNHVDVLLDKNKRKQIILEEQDLAFNTEVVTILMDITRTLGRQGLAFRGSDKDENGNFRQIVKLISRHNSVLRKWLEDTRFRPYHTTYLSASSQNEMIEVLATAVRKKIVGDIREAQFYGIMADTTPDASHQDRLAVGVRYVDKDGKTQERLLEVVEAVDKTGVGLASQISHILTKNELDIEQVVFQSYDFASSMSGEFNGTQQKFSEIVGRTVPYIPCQAHRLNTFVQHSCDASDIISDVFSVLEELYVFFTASTKRNKPLVDKLKEIENALLLRNLSKTRWTARAESLKAVWISYECILQILSEIVASSTFDSKTKTKARGLRKKMLSLDFIASLMFIKNVLYKCKLVTEKLESKNLNIIDAAKVLKACIKSLEIINNDDENMNREIQSAINFSIKQGVDPLNEFAMHHRRRLAPKKLDDNPDNLFTPELLTFYRMEFKKVLDTLTVLMADKLNSCIYIITPLYEIMNPPLTREKLTIDLITKVADFFPKTQAIADIEALQAELEVLLDLCSEAETMDDVSKKSESLKNILPLANRVSRLALTSPVTVASNERTFSKLKIVKNYLRTTMTDPRLNALLMLTCEKDILESLDLGTVVSRWARLKKRRVKMHIVH